jgi:hypothetical protein
MFARFVLSALVVASLALGTFAPAGADGPPADTAAPVYAYDVQVVMVVGTTADLAERAPDWGFQGGVPLTTLAWPDRLLRLKQRGETTLLLDAHTTAIGGQPTETNRQLVRARKVYDRSDESNEYYKATTVTEGVTVKLLGTPDTQQYEFQVEWALPSGETLLLGSWRVHGTIAPQGGKTLVLSHREQVRDAAGELRDVEIYGFLARQPM